MSQRRQYTVFNGDEEERSWQVETLAEGRYQVVTPDGETLEVDAYSPREGRLHLLSDHGSADVVFVSDGGKVDLQVRGERHQVEVYNDRELRMRAAGAGATAGDSPELVSPMAGKVVKVNCRQGAFVSHGDPLVVVEAMKMENDLQAHRGGVVESIEVEAGDAVEIGDVLVIIDDGE